MATSFKLPCIFYIMKTRNTFVFISIWLEECIVSPSGRVSNQGPQPELISGWAPKGWAIFSECGFYSLVTFRWGIKREAEENASFTLFETQGEFTLLAPAGAEGTTDISGLSDQLWQIQFPKSWLRSGPVLNASGPRSEAQRSRLWKRAGFTFQAAGLFLCNGVRVTFTSPAEKR